MSATHWFERARPLDPSQSVAVGPTTRPPDQLLNSNGARMCDALGCRRHVRLVEVHRGVFCRRHAAVAADLRARIAPHRGDAVEAEARVAEIVFRKRPDHGHVHYAMRLSERTRWVDARRARVQSPAAADLGVVRAPTGPIRQTPVIGAPAEPRHVSRPPASWFGPEPDGGGGDPQQPVPARRVHADPTTLVTTTIACPSQQAARVDGHRATSVGQSKGCAGRGPCKTKAGARPPDRVTVPMPRIACDGQSGWVPMSLVARSPHGPATMHCPARKPQRSALQSAICVPAPLRRATPTDATDLDLRIDKRDHNACHVAGCNKVPRMHIDGEGVFCKRHGRVAAAARSRAVALIGDVPFACATVMAGGTNDNRTRRPTSPRRTTSRAWWPLFSP
ncbi:hypothetical protein pdul_cds_94 [Pandoravirus dulcis]|uniref:Uncharacterized protein n=1 Tax=Pandoravirus dulcis TaxID=1349409 RepID=S4VRJ6_9VIRU|nr:hypothetical protein pdul_cds_94 [Pandoravirus dulcis]AGO81995.1 hypothetical protein pdul_cds_94 [Pandoravirus dulcis]